MDRSQVVSFLSELRKKVEGGQLSKDQAEKLAVLALQEVDEAKREVEPKEAKDSTPEAEVKETAPVSAPIDPKSRVLAALTTLEQALDASFKVFQDEINSLLKETSGAAVPLGEFSIGAEELDAKVSIAQKDEKSVVCTYSFKQDWEVADLDLPTPVTGAVEDVCHLGLRRDLLAVAEDVLDHTESALAWSGYAVPHEKIAKIAETAASVRDLRVAEATTNLSTSNSSNTWQRWALATVTHLLGSDYVKTTNKAFESLP